MNITTRTVATVTTSTPQMRQFVSWMRAGVEIAKREGVEFCNDRWLLSLSGGRVLADHIGLALIGKCGGVKKALDQRITSSFNASLYAFEFFGEEFDLPVDVVENITEAITTLPEYANGWESVESFALACLEGQFD